VNYIPLYYMINGVAFNKTNSPASLFPISRAVTLAPGWSWCAWSTAGLRMHVPSIIGSLTGTPAVAGMSLIAEDGNVLPGRGPRAERSLHGRGAKTYDVMVNAPATSAPPATALPIYDRELSLSGNAVVRDAGMLAYVGIKRLGAPECPRPDARAGQPGCLHRGAGRDAHRIGSQQGRDRQRHQTSTALRLPPRQPKAC